MSVSHAKLEKICAKNPTSILFARLADGFLRQGKVKQASKICRRGLRYRPSYVTGHLVMGKCHLAEGRLEEARQEFHKALQLDADNLAALWHLGRIGLEMGWEALARQHFERAYILDPFNRDLGAKVDAFGPAVSQPEPVPASDEEAPDSGPEPGETDPAPPEASKEAEEADLAALVQAIGGGASLLSTPERAGSIATSTLAELYAAQGLTRQALEVLEQVLERDSGNAQAKQRLEELRAMDDAPDEYPQ